MLFAINSEHCTTCHTENPPTNDDGYTTCCNDSVCEVNAQGRCARCNSLCHICGWAMTDGYAVDPRGFYVHPDNTCPNGCREAGVPSGARARSASSPSRRVW